MRIVMVKQVIVSVTLSAFVVVTMLGSSVIVSGECEMARLIIPSVLSKQRKGSWKGRKLYAKTLNTYPQDLCFYRLFPLLQVVNVDSVCVTVAI